MYKYFGIGLLLVAAVAAVPAPSEQGLDCLSQEGDMLTCFAVKAVSTLNRAARSANLQLIDGVTFVRDAPMERQAKALKSEGEMLAGLPSDASEKTMTIASMMFDSAAQFLNSHSLKLSAPENLSRSLDEGRGKLKKMVVPLVSALGLKLFALVPVLLGGLVLMTLKALFVGKIALIIAAILAFQKLFSAGAYASNLFGSKTQHLLQPSTWLDSGNNGAWANANAGAQTHPGYYRSLNDRNDAAKIAYAAQAPENTNEATH